MTMNIHHFSRHCQKNRRVRAAAAFSLAALLAIGGRAGENGGGADDAASARIVVTSFPLWIFTRNLLAGLDGYEIDPLWPAGDGCPHDTSYTPAEQARILFATHIVVPGLNQDRAVRALVNDLSRDARRPVLLDASRREGASAAAGWIPERLPEVTPEEAGRPRPRTIIQRPNPHYFASPDEAARTVESLARSFLVLPGMDGDRARALLKDNRDRYAGELRELAEKMRGQIAEFGNRRIATQHDAFAYFARDLDLRVVAVFAREPEERLSPAALRTVFQRIVARGAGAVYLEPGAPEALARNTEQATRLPVGTLDPVAAGPFTASLDYYQGVMLKNLEELSRHLRHAAPPDPNSDPEPPLRPPPPRREPRAKKAPDEASEDTAKNAPAFATTTMATEEKP